MHTAEVAFVADVPVEAQRCSGETTVFPARKNVPI